MAGFSDDLFDVEMSDTEFDRDDYDLESFQDLVRDHLRRGMTESEVLETSVLELRDMQQAYRQKAEALNSMLAKELLLLAVHIDRENIKRNNTCFLNAFAKVMDTYSSVFTYFIRSKESQYDCLVGLKQAAFDKNDGEYIEPHIEAIIKVWENVLKDKRQLDEFVNQLRLEKTERQHLKEQGGKNANIIAEAETEVEAEAEAKAKAETGAEAGAGVGAGIEAGAGAGIEAGVEAGAGAGIEAGVEAGAGVGTEIEAGVETGAGAEAGTETRTKADVEAIPSHENPKVPPKIVGLNWDEFGCIPAVCSNVDGSQFVSGIFTEFGGKLSFPYTSDHLVIPAGAVPAGELYKVCGRVFYAGVSLPDVPMDPQLDTFITRVCDFHVHGNYKFVLPVTITMHHRLPCRQSLDKVRVLFSENNDNRLEYKRALDTQPEYTGQAVADLTPWIESDLFSIRAKTYHFTRFMGVGRNIWEDTKNVNEAKLNIIGKLVSQSAGSCHIHLKMYLQTNLYDLTFSDKDFMAVKQNRAFDILLTDEFDLPDEFVATDQLVISLHFLMHQWIQAGANFGDDPNTKLVDIKTFARNISTTALPECIAEYLLVSDQSLMICQPMLTIAAQPLPPQVTEPRCLARDLASWNWKTIISLQWSVAAPPVAAPPVAAPPVAAPSVAAPPVAAPPVAALPVAAPPVVAPPVADPNAAVTAQVPPQQAAPPVKPLWERVLNAHREELVRDLGFSHTTLLDGMISAGLLEDTDVDTINNTINELDKRRLVIGHVIRRGEAGFCKFVALLLAEFRHLAEMLCENMWLGWLAEDLLAEPAAYERLSKIRGRYQRRELRYFNLERPITSMFDDENLLHEVVKIVGDCEAQLIDGDDFLCNNVALRPNPLDDAAENYDAAGAAASRGWQVLTVDNCFSLGRSIKNKWINLCVKLLNNPPLFKHIMVTYHSDEVRAQMTLLYWREHWRDQLSADEPGAIRHLHNMLQKCKMDDVDRHLTTLEQEAACRM